MSETRKPIIKVNITKGFEAYICIRTQKSSENKKAGEKSKERKRGNSKSELVREPKGAEGIFGHLFTYHSGQQVKYGLMGSTSPGWTNHFVGHH